MSLHNLPRNIFDHLLRTKLTLRDIGALMSASKTLKLKIHDNNFWRTLIARDFLLAEKTLNELIAEVVKIDESIKIDLSILYKHLHYFSKHKKCANMSKAFFFDEKNIQKLFICCMNIATEKPLLQHFIPNVELEIWITVSIFAKANHTVCAMINKNDELCYQQSRLHQAIIAENLELLLIFLDKKFEFRGVLKIMSLHYAVRSGNTRIIQLLCDNNETFTSALNRYQLDDNMDMHVAAAGSNNLKLMRQLLEHDKNRPLVNRQMLNTAAASGNLPMFKLLLGYIIGEVSMYVSHDTLNQAAKSGVIELLEFLLDPNNKFYLPATFYTLLGASKSGSVQAFRYILDKSHTNARDVNNGILINAAKSGSLALVDYVLDPVHQFGIDIERLSFSDLMIESVDLSIFLHLASQIPGFELYSERNIYAAISSDNFEMVSFFLPQHAEYDQPANSFYCNRLHQSRYWFQRGLLGFHYNRETAHEKWMRSATNCVTQFFDLAVNVDLSYYSVNPPFSEQGQDEAVITDSLYQAMKKAIPLVKTASEKRCVIELLTKANNDRLTGLISLLDNNGARESFCKKLRV